jgi:thioredoxin reductase (NADPH)
MKRRSVVLAVDDDPEVLSALERDLRQRYREEYRVVAAPSGESALETLRELKARGVPVALFLVDQRMPGMSGTDLLVQARRLFPDAGKVLLTAYADTEAAIASINDIGLDHYLLKPWTPPDVRLYPVLDDLLSTWSASVRLPFEGIRVAGSRWSRQCYVVKDFLSRNNVPYEWVDLDADAAMRELAAPLSDALVQLPVVFFADGTHLAAPTLAALAKRVGMRTRAARPFYDLVIVGGGPAGLANAVYGASEGLKTVLVEQNACGGQAGTSSRIENYLGFPAGVTGADLAQRATAQARRFGVEILSPQEMTGLRREDPYRIVTLADGSEVSAYAVLIATGLSVRMLDVPGIESLLGAGVYYGAALSEAAAYRDMDVCVVGGANSAGQGALFFARYARKVSMLVRAGGLQPGMSHYLARRIEATPNIEVLAGTQVTGVSGRGHLERVRLRDVRTQAEREVEMAALFIFIGAAPRTEMLAGIVDRDDKGFIVTGPGVPPAPRRPRGWPLDRDPYLFETNVPGVFAAGDVRAGANRRVAAAVGEGSAAIYTIHKYLETM